MRPAPVFGGGRGCTPYLRQVISQRHAIAGGVAVSPTARMNLGNAGRGQLLAMKPALGSSHNPNDASGSRDERFDHREFLTEPWFRLHATPRLGSSRNHYVAVC